MLCRLHRGYVFASSIQAECRQLGASTSIKQLLDTRHPLAVVQGQKRLTEVSRFPDIYQFLPSFTLDIGAYILNTSKTSHEIGLR